MLAFYLSLIEGDEAKARFEQFYQRFAPRLFAVARRILPSRELAEDAVHTSMVKMIDRHAEKFLEISQRSWDETMAWAVTIVKHTALNMLEKEKRTLPLAEGWDAPAQAEGTVEYHRLVELIHTLPETYREVLELRLVAEWDNGTIARRLGITPSAVATRVSRGLRLLREKVREEGYEHDGQ